MLAKVASTTRPGATGRVDRSIARLLRPNEGVAGLTGSLQACQYRQFRL